MGHSSINHRENWLFFEAELLNCSAERFWFLCLFTTFDNILNIKYTKLLELQRNINLLMNFIEHITCFKAMNACYRDENKNKMLWLIERCRPHATLS